MLTPNPNIPILYVIALAAITLIGCGTSGTTVEGKSSLDKAIASYIDGDLERAEALFDELVRQPLPREDLQTAYLYLGRIYLATGKYDRAAEVLSAGKALGGDVRFDEYLEVASRHVNATAHRIAQETRITRAQLAVLINDLFDPTPRERPAASGTNGTTERAKHMGVEGHWAEDYIEVAFSTGAMTTLPDGEFHPDEGVTRPALYAIVSRIVDSHHISRTVVEDLFPHGYRGTIESSTAGGVNRIGYEFVSGKEAIAALKEVARAAGASESPD